MHPPNGILKLADLPEGEFLQGSYRGPSASRMAADRHSRRALLVGQHQSGHGHRKGKASVYQDIQSK